MAGNDPVAPIAMWSPRFNPASRYNSTISAAKFGFVVLNLIGNEPRPEVISEN